MGPGETIAVIAVVVLLIVVLGLMSETYRRRLAHKERIAELAAPPRAQADAVDPQLVGKLEQRIRVLERIATDKSTDLAARIEDLREPALDRTGDRL